MTFYMFLFFAVIFIAYIANLIRIKGVNDLEISSNRINYSLSIYFLFVSCFILFLVAAVRKDVGIDYTQYSIHQIPASISGDRSTVELFYYYLIRVSYAFMGTQGVFVSTHLLIILFLFLAIKNNSKNFFISILIVIISGFYNTSLNIMRQTIAVSIFLWAIKDIFDGKGKMYTLKIIVAFFFHKTAIIYLPLYFLRKIRFTLKRFLIILIVALLTPGLVNDTLFYIATHFNVYRNYVNIYKQPEPLSGSYLVMNTLLMVFILVCYFLNKQQFSRAQSFYAYLQLICLVILIYHATIPNYDRIMFMFYSASILGLPEFLSMKFNKLIKYGFFVVLILMYGLVFYNIYVVQNIGQTLPYQSFF